MDLFRGQFALIPISAITHTASGLLIDAVLATTRCDQALTRMIRRNGITAPLLVYRRDDGGYALVAGRRRLSAVLEIVKGEVEKPPVPVIVLPVDSWQEVLLGENRARSNNVTAEYEAVASATEQGRWGEIHTSIGEKRLATVMRLRTLSIKARELFCSGELSTAAARYLAQLPQSQQDRALEGANGRTLRALRRAVHASAVTLPLFAAICPKKENTHDAN